MSFFQDVRTQKVNPADNTEQGKYLKQNADGGAEVHVDNFPATQPVSGTVAVNNFPASQDVDANIDEINGTAALAGTGATGAGSLRITVAQDASTVAGAASIPTGSNVIGATNQGSALVVSDPNNSTTTVLAASGSFVGTMTNILAYSEVVMSLFATPNTAKASFYFEFSPDGTHWDVSVPALVRDPTFVIPIPVITVGNFFRVRYLNDGGSAAITALGLPDAAGTPTLQTAFRLTTYLFPGPTKELTRTLDQTIQGSDSVVLGRNVSMGRQPGGGYVNTPAGGQDVNNSSTVSLGSNAVFTGAWVDTQGFLSIVLTVNSDQISAVGGVTVQFSDTSTGVTVRATDSRDYTSADVGLGLTYRFSPRARYYRVIYTNGAVAQTTFFLNAVLNIVPTDLPLKPIVSTLSDTQDSVVEKAIIVGKVGGAYQNVALGTSNGLQTDVNQFEAAAPIKALTSWAAKQVGVTTTAAQVDVSPLANRKSIELRSVNANGNAKVYIGPNSGVTTGSGRELVANEPVTLEIDTTAQVWAVVSSGTAELCVTEIAGTP